MSGLDLTADSELQLFESTVGTHLFLADGSRIFDIDKATCQALSLQLQEGIIPAELTGLIGNDDNSRFIGVEPIAPPKLTSISLNVAQSCNMSCSYCYADEGRFGGKSSIMSDHIAKKAIDQLLEQAPPGSDLVVGFMGGEPFLNRKLVHEAVAYATDESKKSGHRVRFSMTTNATLLKNEDIALLKENPFSVTVSLDGDRKKNDSQRKVVRSKESAYQRALEGLTRLTQNGRPRHVSVRATVTPETGRLLPLLDHFMSLDIDEAGFAPVVASPPGTSAFGEDQMQTFLAHMLECGEKAKSLLLERKRYPFSNFETALNEIRRGTHRPYPCGAGAGYLSVNSSGGLYACHRLIDDEKFNFGDIFNGPSHKARQEHLAEKHVDQQQPCKSCWARYLCGGGCYHEVENRGRIGCDYIRNWLSFCLSSYAEIQKLAPDYFVQPDAFFESMRPYYE